jgi:N-acetylmuramoyl-L-alanine amidase
MEVKIKMDQNKFISSIKDASIESQKTYNILASITIAQAILESGWGSSELYQNANNSFGIKWTNGCGYDKYLITTKEVVNGKTISVQAYFRKYNSLAESVKDHSIFLQKDRYNNLIGDTDYKSVANKLYQDGYSTSPEYPSKLIKLIEQYNLTDYDTTIHDKKEGSNMKFAIDFGHGVGSDRGASGYIDEETIINAVGASVVSKLESLGHTVIQVRPSSASSVTNSLAQRVQTADSNYVDMFVSIHANAGGGVGTEVFTYGGRQVTEAVNVLNNICSLGFTNRGIKDGSNLYVVKNPDAKAMLIEVCFCDTQSDVDKYNSIGADAIADAIVLGLTGSTSKSTTATKLGWNQNTTGWWYCTDLANGYYYKDIWKEIDGNWYSFDDQGYARRNTWLQDNGKWYYLKDSCKMAKSEWVWIAGECYCFALNGALYVDGTTPDGYKVDASGAWIQ